MATRADLLLQALNNVAQRLVDLTAQPKPTYNVDGVNYNWQEYYDSLVEKHLLLEQAYQRASGIYEVRSVGA